MQDVVGTHSQEVWIVARLMEFGRISHGHIAAPRPCCPRTASCRVQDPKSATTILVWYSGIHSWYIVIHALGMPR